MTIASLVHSEKLKSDVWVIQDEEIWEIISDGNPKFSVDEMDLCRELSPSQLKTVADVKRVTPGARIIDVRYNAPKKKK